MRGLLCIGKSDFEAVEPFREDRFFKTALAIRKVPGSVWLRQRLDRASGRPGGIGGRIVGSAY